MTIYLDLNIFDRIEKLDKLEFPEKENYQYLFDLITSKKAIVPYSNAHLNDLFRGFQKNPNYIDGHLNSIEQLTNNLCICQYWGKPKAEIHFRNIKDFFKEKCTEWEFETESYSELFDDEPLMKQTLNLYKLIPLPAEFKQGYKEPMFGIMFPQSKTHNTMYALQEDIYNFQFKLKSDYGLYKSFKTYLFTSLNKLKNNREYIKSINSGFKELPKHLEYSDILDAYTPENKTSDNQMYSKVIDVFTKYDFSGYKTDGNFNNMFDDALHTFYASHFDFFITNDDRCKYKAEKTYEKLKIKTKVLKIDEIEIIKNSH